MIIAIDIGNTTAAFGFFSGDNLILRFSLPSSPRTTAEKCWTKLQGFLDPDMKIEGVICSSVSPDMTRVVKSFVEKYLKAPLKLLKVTNDIGIVNRYEKPEQLGADRIVNALAVKKLYSLPAIIIDLGTAITIDAVSRNSEFLGGIILPGIGISAEAMHKKTSLLPKVELIIPRSIVGKNTVAAMQSGLTYGFSGMLSFIVEKIKEELNMEKPDVILTGGHARIVESLLSNVVTAVDANLTLKGLNCAFGLI